MADDPPSPFLRPQQLSQSPSVSLPLQPEHSQSPVISTGPTGDYCGYQAEDCAEYPDARLSPSAFAAALNDLVAEAATSTGVNGVKSVAWPIGALELGVGACDAGGDENSGNAAMGGRPTEESTGNESRVVWGTAIGKLSDASPGELEDGELANSPTLAPLWKWQNVSAPEKGSGPSRTGFVPLPQGSVLDKGHQAAVPEGPPPFSSFVDLQLPSLAVTPPASTIQFKSAARRFSVAHLPGARFEYHSSPTPDPRLRKKASQNPTGLF